MAKAWRITDPNLRAILTDLKVTQGSINDWEKRKRAAAANERRHLGQFSHDTEVKFLAEYSSIMAGLAGKLEDFIKRNLKKAVRK